MTDKLATFNEVQEYLQSKKRNVHLLLGNGFSMAYNHEIFSYNALHKFIEEQDDPLISSLFDIVKTKNFELVIAGEGFERENLEKKVKLLGIQSNVIFTGKKTRDEVNSIMNEADCFVMVSETEAFGLVYLEAMGKGCITIGTKGQGIDGVIVNGENGFLCEAKNSDNLAEIFKHIYSLPPDKLLDISRNALETAKNMTDHKVAEKYINTVMEL